MTEQHNVIDIPANDAGAVQVNALPDKPKHVLLNVEIRECDLTRFIQMLDDCGIYFHADVKEIIE